MEALSWILSRARKWGFILGFKVGGRGEVGIEVSYLLFVDGILILCDTNQEQLESLS